MFRGRQYNVIPFLWPRFCGWIVGRQLRGPPILPAGKTSNGHSEDIGHPKEPMVEVGKSQDKAGPGKYLVIGRGESYANETASAGALRTGVNGTGF